MAASRCQEENESETTIDVSGFMRAFTNDDDEEDSPGNNGITGQGDVSMFCKACLHPYCGEQKAGTIVLRCERCGQTDTVLEERIDSLNPQEWIGNLMMNRFMQVVKEQEDLSANLTDPLFADDVYQRISLTLSEYTFNVEKIAAQLFDIAKKTRVATDEDKARIEACNNAYTAVIGVEEVQAMQATKTLIEFHKALVLNEPDSEKNESAMANTIEESSTDGTQQVDHAEEDNVKTDETDKRESHDNVTSPQVLLETKSTNTAQLDQSEEVVAMNADGDKYKCEDAKLLERTRERLNHLGATILTLIEKLISKYNLPDDIMETVEQRLRNAAKVEATSEENAEDTEDCTDGQNDHIESGQELENEKDNEYENSAADNSGDEESRSLFNIPTDTIKNEVFEALEHKLKLSFYDAERAPQLNLVETEALCPDISDFQTKEDERKDIESDAVKRVELLETTTEDLQSRPEDPPSKENEDSVAINKANGRAENKEESFMVNFYSLSSEFIRELQRRKSKALAERKDRALANIHDKIQRLKKEMERVEEAVTEELSQAYRRKMKKVEKQKKQLDEKHDQVKEAERLLEYYAMTGQQDKVTELIAQLNVHFENYN